MSSSKTRTRSIFSLTCGCKDSKSVSLPILLSDSSDKSTATTKSTSNPKSVVIASTPSSSIIDEDHDASSTPSFSGLLRQLSELERNVIEWAPPVTEKEAAHALQQQQQHKVEESVAVVKESEDPLTDFRKSMLRTSPRSRVFTQMAAVALKLMAFTNQNHSQSDPYTSSLTTAYSTSIIPTLSEVSTSFILTDPSLPNHPIIFASQSFVATSGFQNDELIGRNARMFQGPKTDRGAVMEIRESVRSETPIQITLVNYKKDGSWFWVLLHLCPVFDSVGSRRVLHFLGVQVPLGGKRNKKAERLYGSCREDVRGVGLDINLFEDVDKRGLEAEESCKANDLEKEKAAFEANNILAILSYYRKHVIEKKCSSSITPLNSSLNISLGRIKQSFVLTDPYLADVPIVYASDAFLCLTGYTKQEVLGRNCRFLSGPSTDVNTLHEIKASIQSKQPCVVRLLNYRKDGSPFWNLLHITPVRNATGKIAFFVEVQINESSKDVDGVSTKMRQMSVVAAVKVAARSLCGSPGPSSRSSEQ